jgi:hypothetical protein
VIIYNKTVWQVSLSSSSQIIVNRINVPLWQHVTENTLARSPVLDTLLPELSVWQTGEIKRHEAKHNEIRHKQQLENIDAYMLKETRQILKRVRVFCSSLTLNNPTRFEIKLQASSAALLITGAFQEKDKLTKLINQDNWLTGAFNWLCPNYKALAHSQELSTFSYAYEKDRQQALHQYRHFEQTDHGMCCYLACNIEQGEPRLTWCLESPKTVYVLKELQP